jgi:subtilisin family serine protease
MLRHSLRLLTLIALLGALVPFAGAQNVSRLRVMLHPNVADGGQLSDATLSLLQSLAGVPLTLAATTRTGALEFTLTPPLDEAASAAMLDRMRNDRSVLWVEPVTTAPANAKIMAAPVAGSAPSGRKVMLKLTGAAVPDWATLLPRLSAVAGSTLVVDHQIGDVWVLAVPTAIPDAQLAQMAALIQSDPAVQYADPVRRATKQLVPNDTFYPQQWPLSDPVGGVNAPMAWSITTGSANTVVAVVDTGVTAHPEFSGRFLPGYDFISDPNAAGDGNGRDNDASDPGDWTNDGQCGVGVPGEASSWHGTFVSGLIAANTNNAAGIAGMNWQAMILPVRVLGKCGGSFDDIVAGVLWAAGLPVTAAPANPSPARVINLSLGGETSCPQAMQDAINAVLAQGTVITVAAGNSSIAATAFAPANCSGVVTVGASTHQGDRASYSNFGQRVDLSAPGGDGAVADWILSTSNSGITSPVAPTYAREIGTSFAAPHVAGTASLMLGRNPNLTPGQVLSIITGTARSFPSGSQCAQSGGACGAGLLNAGLALQNTVSATDSAPPGTVPVIEYYRADKDHYFMTADPAEIAYFDASLSSVYQRTGEVFYAWLTPARAPAGTPLSPVCRFYNPSPLVDSNFFTAIPSECQYMIAHWPGVWNLESPAAFYVLLSDSNGVCPGGSVPIYRFFDNRNDANFRHTRDLTVRREMLNKQWAPNGFGPNGVAFCSPV